MIDIKAPPVHADRIGMRAWSIEALDPAMLAEQVPRSPRAEAVEREIAATLGLAKTRFGDDQVEIAGHLADRAIAVEQLDLGTFEAHLKPDVAAMAAAFDGD